MGMHNEKAAENTSDTKGVFCTLRKQKNKMSGKVKRCFFLKREFIAGMRGRASLYYWWLLSNPIKLSFPIIL